MNRQKLKDEWSAFVKDLRKHTGLSTRELAEQLHCDHSAITHWSVGRYAPSRQSQELLLQVARRYGLIEDEG